MASGIKSVTTITPQRRDCCFNAMVTPVMIMGIKAGMHLINQMKDIEAMVIDDNNTVYAHPDNISFSVKLPGLSFAPSYCISNQQKNLVNPGKTKANV